MAEVISGAHVDYTRSRFDNWQWTFEKSPANIFSQFLGVIIAFALGQLWILALSIRKASKKYNLAQSQQTSSVQGPLQGQAQVQSQSQAPSQAAAQGQGPTFAPGHQNNDEFELQSLPAVFLGEVRHGWMAIRPQIQLPSQTPPRPQWREALKSFLRAVVAFVILAGLIAIAAVASGINGDSKVLLLSRNCSAYQPPAERTFEATSEFETRAQSDAGEYARLCYGDGGSRYQNCNKFIQQKVDYKILDNQTCPFADGLCHLGQNRSVTFTTGVIPASVLGINAGPELQFERLATCAPINMNNTYVKLRNQTTSRNLTGYVFTYHYGFQGIDGNISYQTFTYGDFFEKTPSYLVQAISVIHDAPNQKKQAWFPIDELYTPDGTVLTLLFILPGKIYYPNYSDDPIFPAHKKSIIRSPLTNLTTWMYVEGYARVLGCIDRARWRNLKRSEEWHENNQPPFAEPSHLVDGKEWLLWLALRQSNIYQTISKKLGAALDATSLLTQYLSLPVHKEQWKVEARRLFEISLARASFEVEYIMRGAYADYPGYVRFPNPTVNQRICGSNYLGMDPAYSNVHGIWSLLAIIGSLLVLALSIPTKDGLVWEGILGRYSGKLSYFCTSLASSCVRGISNTISKLWGLVNWRNVGTEILRFLDDAVKALGRAPGAMLQGFKDGIRFANNFFR